MKYLALILFSSILFFGLTGGPAYANTQNSGGSNTQNSGGPQSITFQIDNPSTVDNVQDLLEALLNLAVQVGVPILVIAIIYVGFLFVQAQGNETKLADAKKAFFWTVIGAAIVLGAFVISTAIQNTVDQLTPTSLLVPIAYAAGTGDTFGSLVNKVVNGIFDPLVGFIIGLALLYFLWGLSKFVLNSGDEGAVKEAKQMMVWGVIALFVMVSVWGLVNILTGTFFAGGLPTEAPLPKFQQ